MGSEYSDVRYDSIYDESGVDIYTKADIRYPHGFATVKQELELRQKVSLLYQERKGI